MGSATFGPGGRRRASIPFVAALALATCLLGLGSVARAAAEGEPIPLAPLDDLASLSASVVLEVEGSVDGEPTSGDLVAQLTTTDQGTSRIEVTGSLLGDVVAQVGGSAVRLFRPDRVTVYTVPEGTYIVLDGLFDVCVKPSDSTATEVLAQLSPQSLMTILTSSDVARGALVGEETLEGVPVRHYVIDGEAFLAAAQASGDPNVSRFAGGLTGASDADLFVSVDGDYPVAYRGGFTGAFEPLRFEGDLATRIDLTATDQETTIELPGACDRPIPA